MKRYIVNEDELNNLMDAAYASGKDHANEIWLRNAMAECQRIEVPEWVTHFACSKNVDFNFPDSGNRIAGSYWKSEEIPK